MGDPGRKSKGRCSYTIAEGASFPVQWRTGVGRWGGNVSELFAQDVTIYSHTRSKGERFKHKAGSGEQILCKQ